MRTNADSKPDVLQALGNGSYAYHWDYERVTRDDEQQGEHTSWSCNEVVVYAPLSANKIVEAVIASQWDANYEQKLINEFNAAQLGMVTGEEADERIKRYKQFLADRADLKATVDKDCAELGIK